MNVRKLGQTLAQPRARVMIASGFALAISWQLLLGGTPAAIWFTIFGSWAASIACLFVMSRGEPDDDDEAEVVEVSENSHV